MGHESQQIDPLDAALVPWPKSKTSASMAAKAAGDGASNHWASRGRETSVGNTSPACERLRA